MPQNKQLLSIFESETIKASKKLQEWRRGEAVSIFWNTSASPLTPAPTSKKIVCPVKMWDVGGSNRRGYKRVHKNFYSRFGISIFLIATVKKKEYFGSMIQDLKQPR